MIDKAIPSTKQIHPTTMYAIPRNGFFPPKSDVVLRIILLICFSQFFGLANLSEENTTLKSPSGFLNLIFLSEGHAMPVFNNGTSRPFLFEYNVNSSLKRELAIAPHGTIAFILHIDDGSDKSLLSHNTYKLLHQSPLCSILCNYIHTSFTTSTVRITIEKYNNPIPTGINATPITKNVGNTVPAVRIGCQAEYYYVNPI
ncbi:hypothetical protein V1477_001765 [Vespula maculifrons]|uniref:Uncharacterized protein n=1 Tax=Vespula maculifrons TaxID=7453 RepID=A0ABD2CX12_VESMC